MVVLTVRGMNCGPCAKAVTEAVRSVDPDAEVKVDLGTKLVAIDSVGNLDRIKAAIDEAGYKVDPEMV
ncbi:heavy-metal-associated domain-containing protein [Sphingosinicella sp. LHD-64]|uniref:heavy-metal-associated domain-containing protein n=1 Tax=Sphingosinicella sp. LHD-64 TaxID=3072139 RepID=UPI00280F551E|nr:heavy-metal-associated domain-containing protein [Sphingosinicella sp. LHD-64]MDQ8757369.1 heavy-metal-associated domain-containing protein [Sphingosinicella sp. LHD-64]